MDLLGSLSKTFGRDQFVLVKKVDYFHFMKRCVDIFYDCLQILSLFMVNGILLFDFLRKWSTITKRALKDPGDPIMLSDTMHSMSVAYEPQTDGEAQHLSETITANLRHYISKQRSYWDVYVQS